MHLDVSQCRIEHRMCMAAAAVWNCIYINKYDMLIMVSSPLCNDRNKDNIETTSPVTYKKNVLGKVFTFLFVVFK